LPEEGLQLAHHRGTLARCEPAPIPWTAFSMLMVDVALVAGLLFANALVQPRQGR
jgi:hypothetical protein